MRATAESCRPARELERKTKAELYEHAKEQHIQGRSKMAKDELIEALSKH